MTRADGPAVTPGRTNLMSYVRQQAPRLLAWVGRGHIIFGLLAMIPFQGANIVVFMPAVVGSDPDRRTVPLRQLREARSTRTGPKNAGRLQAGRA